MGTTWSESEDETQQPSPASTKKAPSRHQRPSPTTSGTPPPHVNPKFTATPPHHHPNPTTTDTTPPLQVNPMSAATSPQLLLNQDGQKRVAAHNSKAIAIATEPKLPHNRDEELNKKKMISPTPSFDVNPKANGKQMISPTPSFDVNPKANGKQTDVKMPHNFEAIVKNADSPINRSSVEKLLEQLQAGVFLDQKRKKYWVERKSNANCFMIYAKDLSITWGEDPRYWRWNNLKETSDESIVVAELLDVCWLEVHGSFRIDKLSPGILYEVVFVAMMKDPAYGWEVPVKLRLVLPDGKTQEHEENLMEKPKRLWIEIPAGELRASTEKRGGEIQFSLYEYKGGLWKRGLIIKGVAVRPKN